MRMLFLLIAAVFCGLPFAVAEPPLEVYSTDCWQISGQPGKITWIEIHNRQQAQTSGIAHLEVLARKKGVPVWEIEHVCAHLAVTTAALQHSVTHPYKTRPVYPETYAVAYERWKTDEQKGTAVVCSTSIQDFLGHR